MNRMLVLGVAAVLALGVAAIAFASTGGDNNGERQSRLPATATAVPPANTPEPKPDDEDAVTGETRELSGEAGGQQDGDQPSNGDLPAGNEVPPVAPDDASTTDSNGAVDLPLITDEGNSTGGGSMPSEYTKEEIERLEELERREANQSNGSSPPPDTPVSSSGPHEPITDPAEPAEPPSGDRHSVPAPIEVIDIQVMESAPPQYAVWVQAGLPSGCAEPDTYNVERGGNTVRISVTNTMPVGDVACTMIYGIYDLNINLGSDFEPGQTYTVFVNDEETSFTAQ